MLDLAGKTFAIFGLKGTGKTVLAKHILKQSKAGFVYDVLHEYRGFNRYIVSNRQHTQKAIEELNLFVSRVIIGSKQIRLFILDEANRYCPPKPQPLPESILELNDFNRHYNISFGVIARRPTQLHSDLVELANYLFIFQLKGKNDIAYLDNLASGLGDAVVNLPPYHFVQVNPNHTFQVQQPVAIS